jgi:O-methyltransferase
MTEGIAWTTSELLAAYDFSRFERLVDIGGGEGALLRAVLDATPSLHGILFDLPQVVTGASQILTGEIAARCQVVGGNFFDSVLWIPKTPSGLKMQVFAPFVRSSSFLR